MSFKLKTAARVELTARAGLAATAALAAEKGKIGKTAREGAAPKGREECVQLLAAGRFQHAAVYLSAKHGLNFAGFATLAGFTEAPALIDMASPLKQSLKTYAKQRAARDAAYAEHAAMLADAAAIREASRVQRAALANARPLDEKVTA